MLRQLKSITPVAGTLAGLLVLAAIALFIFRDVSADKARFESAVSDIAGMEVTFGEHFGIDFFPSVLIKLNDVHVRNRGSEIANASAAGVSVDLLSLLHREIRIRKIRLEQPSLFIEKGSDGKFNFEKAAEAKKNLPDLALGNVSFSGGTIRYMDKQTGAELKAVNCNMDMQQLRLSDRQAPGMLKKLSLVAEFACERVQARSGTVSDLKFTVSGRDGIFEFKPIALRAFSGQGSGSLSADFNGPIPRYYLRYTLTQFHIEELLKILSPKNVTEGSMDFSADMQMQGKNMSEARQSMKGQVSLHGKNLILNGRNLDQEFERYESSQNFSLVDVGALFLAGPAGLAVTKGYDFANILRESEGHSEISTLVSEWKVERGVARSQDVAMATNKNRVALQGTLDLVNQRFDQVTVALIDARGCIKAQQDIHGNFSKPVVENPSVLRSLSGPMVKLLKQMGNFFPGGACEVFYAGSVAPPK